MFSPMSYDFIILWRQDDDLAKQVRTLKFLVLDEADRMIEAGHFAELEKILRLTLKQSRFVILFTNGRLLI